MFIVSIGKGYPITLARTPQFLYLDCMYVNDVTYMILKWVVSSVALLGTAYLIPGFRVRDFGSALKASLVIGLANIFIRPVLLFLTFPINILTLGLFTFVVNAIILRLAAGLIRGFEITGWMSAIFGAVILSVIGTLFHYVIIA